MTAPLYPSSSSSLVDRMRRAALLDARLYEEVEHDTSATGQAAVVVALSTVAAAVGNVWRGGGPGVIGGLVSALVGWAAWSGIAYLVGTRLFHGRATWGEVLRTVGFAQAPGLLLALRIVPGLGWIVSIVVWVWLLLTGFVALRQALDLDTGKTALTVVVGWLAYVVTGLVLGLLLRPFG
mgnify:CR=1 FL=1